MPSSKSHRQVTGPDGHVYELKRASPGGRHAWTRVLKRKPRGTPHSAGPSVCIGRGPNHSPTVLAISP